MVRPLLLSLLTIGFSLGPHLACAQQPSTEADFRSTLQRIHRDAAKWEQVVDANASRELIMSHAQVSSLAQNQALAHRMIQASLYLADQSDAEGKLALEVALLTSIQSVQTQLQQLANAAALIDRGGSSQRNSEWVRSLSSLASGEVDDVYNATFSYVIHRVDTIDQHCPAPEKQ